MSSSIEEIPSPGGSPMPSSDAPVIEDELEADDGIDGAVPSHEYVTPGKESNVEEPGKQFPFKAVSRAIFPHPFPLKKEQT